MSLRISTLLLLFACSADQTVDSGSFTPTMSAQRVPLGRGGPAVVAEGADLVAELPLHGIRATFSAGAVRLQRPRLGVLSGASGPPSDHPDGLALRFVGWGRSGREGPVLGATFTMADCPEASPLPCSTAVEVHHGGLVERWFTRPEGVQVTWELLDAPAGTGDVTLQLALTGVARTELTGDGANLVDSSGLPWHLSAPVAWDAEGRPVAAWLDFGPGLQRGPGSERGPGWEAGEADLHIGIDPEGATFPITVDPVLSAPSLRLPGEVSWDLFGRSVASAGDVNGDGYGDIVVGAYLNDAGGFAESGRVYVFHGGPTGPSALPAVTIDGAPGSRLGYSVAGAGDVNGDGFDDIVLGAHLGPGGSSVARGQVLVHLGSASGIVSTPAVSWTGATLGEQLGYSVAGIGDVNADGFSDLLVAAPYATASGFSNAGRVDVHLGGAAGPSATPTRSFSGVKSAIYFGSAVAAAGDINGDGYDDVIIGAPRINNSTLSRAGATYVHLGSASGLQASSRTIAGEAAEDLLGSALASAGDVNGDGFSDVLIGAPYHDPGGVTSAGRGYLYLGGTSGLASTPALTLDGTVANEQLGASFAAVGDVDADGWDDLLVGAPGGSAGGVPLPGRADLFLGNPAGAIAGLSLNGGASGDAFGISVAGGGDLNGDGYTDVYVGAHSASPPGTVQAGQVELFYGYVDADGDGVVLGGEPGSPQDCDDEDAAVGPAPCSPGDADDDGVTEEEDCDDSDPDVGGPTVWHLDYDGDGLGSSGWTVNSCLDLGALGVFTRSGEDCDDEDAAVMGPAQHCLDADGDGLGASGASADCLSDCAVSLPGRVTNDTDCDDGDLAIGAPTSWHIDEDGDGHGGSALSAPACTAPPGTTTSATDCDDADAHIFPGASDTCGDGVDADCDGIGDSEADDEDGDAVASDVELAHGADPCDPDDDGDGVLAEGPGDADFDGVLDYLDPVDDPYFVINGDADWTTTSSVTLHYSAPAGSNQICASNSLTETCAWATIGAGTKTHTLSGSAGTKTVWLKFRNSTAPTVVTTLSDTIGYDNMRPTDGALAISAGPNTVQLDWSAATDAHSGVVSYTVVQTTGATAPSSCSLGTVVAAGLTEPQLTLSGLNDGTQLAFRVCASDLAGNRSTGIFGTETPGADQTPPTAALLLEAGAAATANRRVNATLSGSDAETAITHYCLSTTTSCSSWLPWSATGLLTFSTGTATRTGYLWVRDANNNESSPAATDTILVDTTRPVDGTLTLVTTESQALELSWTPATDAHAGLASYTLVVRAGTPPSNCGAASGITRIQGLSGPEYRLEGLSPATAYGIRVCAVDAVGNVSTGRALRATTLLAPPGPFALFGG